MIVAAAVIIWRYWPWPPTEPPGAVPAQPVSLDGAAIAGSSDARVVVIEYSDFQCPYCGRFARDLRPALEDRFVRGGQVRWAFRHLPIERIHPFAFNAAEAAECSRRQGQFSPMHDSLFQNQQVLDKASLFDRAQTIGLDMTRFSACMAAEAKDVIQRDLASAKELAVSSTPTFFIGTAAPDGRVTVTRRLSGLVPQAKFEQALEEVINPKPAHSTWVPLVVVVGVVGTSSIAAWTIRRRFRSRRVRTQQADAQLASAITKATEASPPCRLGRCVSAPPPRASPETSVL